MVADLAMGDAAARPYFHGYVNGKSAVAVPRGVAAAGVHGWRVEPGAREQSAVLAGPSVLHHHFASAEAFCRKYLALAGTDGTEGPILFEPYKADRLALELVGELRRDGASHREMEARLMELRQRLTRFSAEETEILEAANLLLEMDDTRVDPRIRADR